MKEQEHEAFGACIEKHFPAPTPPTGTAPSAVREREHLLVIMGEFFQAGAAWQRTQSAGVPEGWRLVPTELAEPMLDAAHELYGTNEWGNASDDEIARLFWRTLLAAAPAQPAAQEDPLHITNRPLIRNAISLLRLRQPVAPDVARVADDLEAMLDGQPTPAGEPSDAWLQVAEQVDQQEELHVWRATTRSGETCHFGEASIASAWAGENGTVERVELTPVPELRLVERQEQEEVQRLREAAAKADDVLAALTACTTPLVRLERKYGTDWSLAVDRIRTELVAALAAITGKEVKP